MIEYVAKPCRTGAAYEIIIREEGFKRIMEKIEEMKEFLVVKNDFITILEIENLQISISDKRKIIFRGEEREDVVKKLFYNIFLSEISDDR